jgi:hypothetical protein
LELANTPSHFLLAVQIGITLIVILAGALGGRTLADRVAVYIAFSLSSNPTARPLLSALVVLASLTFRSSSASWPSLPSGCALSRDSRDRRCPPPPLALEDIVPASPPPEYFHRRGVLPLWEAASSRSVGYGRGDQNFGSTRH